MQCNSVFVFFLAISGMVAAGITMRSSKVQCYKKKIKHTFRAFNPGITITFRDYINDLGPMRLLEIVITHAHITYA